MKNSLHQHFLVSRWCPGRNKNMNCLVRAIQSFWAASNSNLYSARAANGEVVLSRRISSSRSTITHQDCERTQERERYIRRILYMIIRHHQLWPPARSRDDLSRQYVTRRTTTAHSHTARTRWWWRWWKIYCWHTTPIFHGSLEKSTKNTRQLRNKAAGGWIFFRHFFDLAVDFFRRLQVQSGE